MTKNIKSAIVFTIIFALAAFGISSADSDYQVGTRGEAIGFAFSVLADEPFGSLYNPAGPAFSHGYQAQVGYQMPTEYGLSPIEESPYGAMMGVNYSTANMGTVSFNSHRYGSFSDPSYVTTTNAINLSYAHPFGQSLSAGIGIKYLFESDFEKRNAFDFDLGVKYRINENISVGGVLENATRANFNSDLLSAHLDRKVRVAGAYHLQLNQHIASFLLGTQFTQNEGEDVEFTNLLNVGTEWWLAAYSDISLGARGGYTFGKYKPSVLDEQDYSRWSLGFSLNFNMQGNDLRIDYAIRSYPYESDESLTADQFLSVSYGWGGVPDYFAGKEIKDDKYDLTKYQQSQDWQTPESVEKLREPVTVVETPIAEPGTQVELPVEVASKPQTPVAAPGEIAPKPKPAEEPAINTPVGIPPTQTQAPPEVTQTQEPVSLTIVDNTILVNEQPIESPVSISEPKPVVETPIEPTDETTPVSLKIIELPEPEKAPVSLTPAPVAVPTPTQNQVEQPQSQMPEVVATEPPMQSEPPVIAQIPEEEPAIVPVINKPKRAPQPEEIEYEKLELSLDANQMSALGMNKVIFTMRPNAILHLESWKLYVFAKKPKKWNPAVIDDYAMAIIRGKGVTPLTIVWDGTLARGGTIAKGKYYFIVVGQDSYGTHYKTKWRKFKVQ